MSLYPFRDFWNQVNCVRPSKLFDQHFGLGLTPEDLLAPISLSSFQPLLSSNYYRPWRVDTADTGSTVQCGKDKFQVSLDVQQFRPEEISVKVANGSVVVEGKHEEKPDEHGFISRQFCRRYVLPQGYEMKDVQSSLSSDGVLTVSVPKSGAIENKERVVPITHTGPTKAVQEQKKEE